MCIKNTVYRTQKRGCDSSCATHVPKCAFLFMSRPEHIAPPEIFYGQDEAQKYTSNSRIAAIQAEMSLRAVELLHLPSPDSPSYSPRYLLDIGCGSGLSGEILDEDGHCWVGLDIAPAMLAVARQRQVQGDLCLADVGLGLAMFKPGTFDGVISISVLQWLCNADHAHHHPHQRLSRFFMTLYACLVRGARAIFQFYPENDAQLDLIMKSATRCGFTGGLVVDYPQSVKARKFYLCLFAGQDPSLPTPPLLPQGLSHEHDQPQAVQFEQRRLDKARREREQRQRHGPAKHSKEWILKKKALNKKRGKEVPQDSKYTGRTRRPRF